jgi:hypothetical protein
VPVGQLVVTLSASIAEFQQDLGKAAAIAEQQSRRINAAFASVKSGLASLGALGIVGAIVEYGVEVIKTAESLNQLSADTGSSVEELSRLSNIAKISGKDFSDFQTVLLRLAAGLNGSEEGSSKTAQALQFLGITAKDPAAALQEVANKLALYADGSGKAAIARDLFGRGGAAFLSTLKEMAEATDVAATTTSKQAQEAETLARDFRQLQTESTTLKDIFLNDVVPALTEVVTAFAEARKSSDNFFQALVLASPGLNPFASIVKSQQQLRDEIDQTKDKIANPDTGGFLNNFLTKDYNPEATKAGLQKNLAQYQQQLAILNKVQLTTVGSLNDPTNFDARDIRARQKPALPYASNTAAGDDPAKKLLDGHIKALNADIDEEKALLATRNETLSKYYDQGYLSLAQFYDKQAELRKDNLATTVADYQQELAANDAYINARDKNGKQAHSDKDIQDVRNKSIDITKKLQLAEQEYGKQSVASALDRIKAEEDYKRSLDDIAAQLLTLQGKSADAFTLNFDNANATKRRSLTATISDPNTSPAASAAAIKAQQQLQQIEDIQLAQAKINDETAKYATTLAEVGTAQQRIDLGVQTGDITELDGYRLKAQASAGRLDELKQELAAATAVANGITDQDVQRKALANLDQLSLKIQQLQADGDALGQKFRGIFVDDLTNALVDVATGTKSVKDAFSDMAKSILRDLDQIASKNIADTLFGKGGPLGAVPDLLAGWFGGKSSASPWVSGQDLPGGADSTISSLLSSAAPITTMSTAALSATASLNALAASAAAASGAGGAGSSLGSLGSIFGASDASPDGSLFDLSGGLSGIPGFAGGTDSAPGGFARVGERGMEILNIPRGAQVIPNAVLQSRPTSKQSGGGDTHNHYYNINVNVPSNTSRSTASQTGASVARDLARSRARNG